MKVLTPLLFPFSILYDAITSIRNRLYDNGLRPSAKFEIPVISIGNLSVGGTGKTPMVEYLVRLLKNDYRLATLSRGYGRKTKGIRIANNQDDASAIGDEPFQFYTKFKDGIIVAVGEERAFAIPHILDQHPDTNLILLDDAFQHRRVTPDFQILLTDFNNLFTRDLLLPAGRLRESRTGASRADIIVVTKCPPKITADRMIEIENSIRKYSKRPVFFTSISYGNILPVKGTCISKPEKIILVTGIANADPLKGYLHTHYNLVRHFSFPDHHVYSEKDLKNICSAARQEKAVVVTTEKDVAKMQVDVFTSFSVSLHYLPIEVEFLKSGKEFDEIILNVLTKHA